MSNDQQLFWSFFHELFESLPRQGPGLEASTLKALACLPPVGPKHRILDVGCGSGTQTLVLAQHCPANIVATDLHQPFLRTLEAKVAELNLRHRITTVQADMGNLPFADGEFDVVWAEGSSFIIGFAKALELWQRLVKPGGYMVISELTTAAGELPAELRDFCLPNPEEDGSVEGRLKAVRQHGYDLVTHFALPKEGWSQTYYEPLRQQLEPFERRHQQDPAALEVASHCRHELDLFQRYGDLYGYTFFVMKRPE